MRWRLCGSIACGLGATIAAPSEATSAFWDPGSGGNGHYYELVLADNPTWQAARVAAAAMSHAGLSGHLATFVTRAEQDFVTAALGGGAAINQSWLGGYQDIAAADYAEPYGGWRWITGETWLGVASDDPVVPRADAGFNNVYYDGRPEAFTITWWNSGGINDLVGNPSAQYADGYGGPARGYIVEYEAGAVPEPASWATLLAGLGAIGMTRRRRRTALNP